MKLKILKLSVVIVIVTIAAGYIGICHVAYPADQLLALSEHPLVVVDSMGTILRSIPSTNGRPGRHPFVSLDKISSHVILTVIATEDRNFYKHRGVDLEALLRSAYLNIIKGSFRYGGSTITMQLMRMIHSKGKKRTLYNKLREIVYALRLEQALSKNQILEQYLNRTYYGHQAYGIESAAWQYFSKPAISLSLAEATFLCVLPRGPSFYDPVTHYDRVLKRRDHLLDTLVKRQKIVPREAGRAREQKLSLKTTAIKFQAPHFVDWVLSTLEEDVKKRGGTVHTSLDLALQRALQHRVDDHVDTMEDKGIQQGGALVIEAQSGKILTMVGSRSYQQSPHGQINITTRRRYPGSALKPFVYATAIENGESPSSITVDARITDSGHRIRGNSYKQRGPVRLREALAGSYNLGAMRVLEKVGLKKVIEKLRRAGVAKLERSSTEYGLRLALGNAKVRLMDLAAGYGFLVRDGMVISPWGVTKVKRADGRIWHPARPPEKRLFSAEVSWLIMDMLSDAQARKTVFGRELPCDLPYPIVAKTGTAQGFSDNVAIFATREFIVAAWTGRFDGGATKGVLGMNGSAPLARAGLLLASQGKMLSLPQKPNGIVQVRVCPVSGKPISKSCPLEKLDFFIKTSIPKTQCDRHKPLDDLATPL